MAKRMGKTGRKTGNSIEKTRTKRFTNPAATSYSGPVLVQGASAQDSVNEMNFSNTGIITASVGGAVDLVYGTGGVTAAPDWSSNIAVWHEYRVLCMELEFMPISISSTTAYPLVGVLDRGSSATLGGYNAAVSHESSKLLGTNRPWKLKINMSGPDEAVWTSTATTFNAFYIKIYGDTYVGSQTLGRYLIRYRVQFRSMA